MGLSKAYHQLLSFPGTAADHSDHLAWFSPDKSTAQDPPGIE